jgi:electron-transferring-flavoprotein dehydrogenase
MTDQPLNEVNAKQGQALDSSQRESMEYDVLIVGAGPAGLSSAIKLKQLSQENNIDLSVCVLEKASEVGAHILSGAVIETIALDKLLPNWKEMDSPIKTKVKKDRLSYFGKTWSFPIPQLFLPPLMKNHGNYIVSLGNVCKWLGEVAEGLGVEIYPGFSAAEVLFDEDNKVKGVATGDMGVSSDGTAKDSWESGMELHAKYTLFSEGTRGSLSKFLIENFNLSEGKDYQKYGIGLKELWEIKEENHSEGLVDHSMGWPLSEGTSGGSFLYHFDKNLVSIGYVIHLNYTNPYVSPFDEFQQFKTHPSVKRILSGGKRISYGARAITTGGYQSVPKLYFPGGALIGCSAGFLNYPKIKGTHNAMDSGILAAEAIIENFISNNQGNDLKNYQEKYEKSRIFKELKKVRNVKPYVAKYGLLLGTLFSGIEMWFSTFGIMMPYTLGHNKPDYKTLRKCSECKEIKYPKPDGKYSFDKLSSVFLSNTNHEEDQPIHLALKDEDIPIKVNLKEYDEPAQRYCPAGVYEVLLDDNGGEPVFQINAQNCVHCKTCDIKDPAQNINWVVPQGGEGPLYGGM